MKLVVIAGFLGSGKTTLLLGLVSRLVGEDGLDFVILENEIGEVSIDGVYLEKQGLQVKELYSGCVCCQLAGDLVVTLREVREVLDPDCVILEASGLARVEGILDTLDKYYRELDGILVISLADLERFELYQEEPMPFVINQIKHAGLVVLNKSDSGGDELIDDVEKGLLRINPQAEVVRASALHGTNLDRVADKVGAWMRTIS